MLTVASPGAAATEAVGACLAAVLQGISPELILLSGGLGAGKTTLVRGCLRRLGHAGTVKSPTFTLVEPYSLPPFGIYHFDLYRLAGQGALEGLGFRDYLHAGAVLLVEWPERVPELAAQADWQLELTGEGEQRSVAIKAGSASAEAALSRELGRTGLPFVLSSEVDKHIHSTI